MISNCHKVIGHCGLPTGDPSPCGHVRNRIEKRGLGMRRLVTEAPKRRPIGTQASSWEDDIENTGQGVVTWVPMSSGSSGVCAGVRFKEEGKCEGFS